MFPAYTIDEIDEKTKDFRASANVAPQDDGSTLGVSILSILFTVLLTVNLKPIMWLKTL